MVMINQFDLIGDTDIDDPSLIALARKKAAAAAAAADAERKKAAADAAAADAADDDDDDDPELTVEETQKGVLSVPHGDVPYQDGGYPYQDSGLPYQVRRGQDGRGRGPGRNFESNRNGYGYGNRNGYGYGFSAVPEDIAQELQGKPSIRGHSDQPYRGRGGGRGRGYLNRDNGEYAGRPARRQFEHRSGFSSPPAKFKGELAPLVKDVPVPQVELGTTDKFPEQNLEENALDKNKEGMANGREEKEPEVKVMTLEEYQKVLEEKRKTLVAMKKTQERKVDVDKEFESMQQLVVKKENNEFFIKLGNDKEAGKRKEDTDGDERVRKDTDGDEIVKKDTDRVERAKKSVSMYEFLRLAEGCRRRGGRGGRGGRGYSSSFPEQSIKDARQFPALGGKEVEQHNSEAQGKKVEQHSSAAAQGKKV